MTKPGVLLCNLGSPASTSWWDVARYLREFLMDYYVIREPYWKRWMIVHLAILPRRPFATAHAYRKIWTDQGSPLVATTVAQGEGVAVRSGWPVEIAMRYGRPTPESAIERLLDRSIDSLVVVPLYPHYAESSYRTAVERVEAAIRRLAPKLDYRVIPPFHDNPRYIDSLASISRPFLDSPHDHLLMSFHGLPESHLRLADPTRSHCLSHAGCCNDASSAFATCYRAQCIHSARLFAARAGIPGNRFSISFQSRLGKEPWLGPYTDHVLADLPGRGIRNLLVMSSAFVSDCLETLEEIALAGKETFLHAGGESYRVIPCLNVAPVWLDALTEIIREPAGK